MMVRGVKKLIFCVPVDLVFLLQSMNGGEKKTIILLRNANNPKRIPIELELNIRKIRMYVQRKESEI